MSKQSSIFLRRNLKSKQTSCRMESKKKEEYFKKIVDENSERIKRICRYYSPNLEEEKDMYQEVLVNVWKSLENFRGDSAISTWVYRIAVNTSLGYTGKTFRRMRFNVDVDTANLSSIVDEQLLRDKLEQEANIDRLQLELNQLSVIEKTLMSLVIEGLSTKEISDVIGLTEPNVRVKIHRIKENLKQKLKSENYEPQI